MARIAFAIGPDSQHRVVDQPSEYVPDRHHVWITMTGEGSGDDSRDQLTLQIGSYGVPTNEQVVASANRLIDALTGVRDAARQRIADAIEAPGELVEMYGK